MEACFLGSRELRRTPLEMVRIFPWRFLHTIYWWFYSLTLPESVKKDYNKLIKRLDTPLKVQSWLWANVKYRKDTKPWHQWQPALTTFKAKAGDCEDWAIFANECLRKKYVGHILCMYTKDSGHATYLIRDGKKRWTSVGTFGLQSHWGTVPEIIPDWWGFKDWTMATLMDEDLTPIEVYYR